MHSIEKIYVKDIANIVQYNFQNITGRLGATTLNMAAVLYKTDIYVVGTWRPEGIDVIDTVTESVTLLPHNLLYSIWRASSIIIDNILYAFGGYSYSLGTSVNNQWMYYIVLSTLIFRYITLCLRT